MLPVFIALGALLLFLLLRGRQPALAVNGRVLLMLLLVGLLVTNLISLSRINELESRIGSVAGESINRHNQVMAAIGSLSGKVQAGPEPERYIALQNYEFTAIDEESARVAINVEFAKLPASSRVRLLYKDAAPTADDWTSITPTKLEALSYKANVTLPSDRNYTVKVVVEAPSETISESLRSIDLQAMMEERINLEFAVVDVDKQGKVTYVLWAGNNYLKNEALKVNSIVAKIYYNGVLIEEKDILPSAERHESSDNLSEKWDYRGQVSIGQQRFDDQLVTAKIVVTDGLGKAYMFEYPRMEP